MTSPCPLCSSSDTYIIAKVRDVEYGTTEELYVYSECGVCKCVYLLEPPINEISTIYPDTYYSVSGPGKGFLSLNKMLEGIKSCLDYILVKKAMKRISGEQLSCLDVGGGTGWMSNIARKADSRVNSTTIIDINEKSRSVAESNGHRFIIGVVDSMEFQDEFSFVLLVNLIEHVPDPRATLNRLHSAMQKDGIMLIRTPNTDSINCRIFKNKYWGGYHAPRHFVLFNKENMFELVKDCGFAIEEFKYSQGAPQWVASILGVLENNRLNKARKPMYAHPLAPFLTFFFAALDFTRAPFSKTDQMIFVLRKC